MFSLEHRVRVFVFQVLERETLYLLVRPKPAAEWPLGPVVGPINLDEHLQDAVVRGVREETGIERPLHIMDLSQPRKELFGDVGLVEWSFAYQAGASDRPMQPLEVVPGPDIDEIAWMGFEEAFERIETSQDRENLIRLRWRLEAG